MITVSPGDWLVAHGLELGLVPEPLAGDLREVRDGLYATQPRLPAPYELGPFLGLAASGRRGDLALLGETGRGTIAWALHFYVVEGGAGVLVQTAWGGAYGDEDDDDARAFAGAVRSAAELLGRARHGTLAPPERLLAYSSSFSGEGWARLPRPVDELDGVAWHTGRDPFAAAAATLGPEGARRFGR